MANGPLKVDLFSWSKICIGKYNHNPFGVKPGLDAGISLSGALFKIFADGGCRIRYIMDARYRILAVGGYGFIVVAFVFQKKSKAAKALLQYPVFE
jgi:hypothetical protein